MERSRLFRQQFAISLTTASQRLLSSNPKRHALVISSPLTFEGASSTQSLLANAVNTAATGIKQSFTIPAGQVGILQGATAFLDGGTAPTVALQVVRGANTTTIAGGVAPQVFTGNVQLLAGDTVQWNVTAAGVGSTCDFSLSIQLSQPTGRITLGFNGPAVLDQGVTLNQGAAPFVLLYDHVGQALTEDISVIASVSGIVLGGLDILEIDCPCSPMTSIDPKRQQ